MQKRRLVWIVAAAAILVGGVLTNVTASNSAGAAPLDYKHLNKIQKRILSGTLSYALAGGTASPNTVPGGNDDEGDGPDGLPDTPPTGYATAGSAALAGSYVPTHGAACTLARGTNVKVNQNCLNVTDSDLQGRGQANNETSIAQDPLHPSRLIASDNDYVRGDGNCGTSYSTDRGSTWTDSTVPDVFTRGSAGNARQYWQAGGDTSVAWDTRGNAYLSCQVFNRGTAASADPDESSGFLVLRSTGNFGASWNFPGRYTTVTFDPAGTSGVLQDKALLTVDNNVSSPYRDRIYVTWTEFAADGSGYIYEVHSSDYGQTFSPRVLVSRTSPLCVTTFGAGTPHGKCNENQDSDPFVGADGALYVAYDNFNNAVSGRDNRNQVLLDKSTDGGASFAHPVKVSDYYDLPDCATYQGDDAGRACVPEKGSSTKSVFRATNYPSGTVNPTNPKQVVVTFGSYINSHSDQANGCAPAGFSATGNNLYTGVKTPGACNNDILVSSSTNAGGRFTGTSTDPRQQTSITPGAGQAKTDQFWQWSAFTQKGRLAVSYYDRQYGRDEFNGSSDISLSGSTDLTHFGTARVTSSSMPAPTQFFGTNGGLFYGDYTGLTAVTDAYPAWMDTRSKDVFICPGTATGPGSPPALCSAVEPNGQVANDQDIYTARTAVPSS